MTEQLRPVRTCLIGVPTEVAAALRTAQARGHLIDYGTPRALPDYRVAIDVTLLRPVLSPRPMRPAVRAVWRRPACAGRSVRVALAGAATATLGGLTYVVVILVQWVMAHLVLVVGLPCMALAVLAVARLRLRGGRRDCC